MVKHDSTSWVKNPKLDQFSKFCIVDAIIC